jgi:hypothetical protein
MEEKSLFCDIRSTSNPWDVVYSPNMAIACLITHWIITYLLSGFVDRASDLLGGCRLSLPLFFFQEHQGWVSYLFYLGERRYARSS